MTWLIVAMGVLLMLVGAVSVISGAPIIQIERGWAEVISGSVAVSGGAITFAIGMLMLRLQIWQQQALGGRPVAAATAAEVVPQPLIERPELRPTRAPEDSVHVAEDPVSDEPVLADPDISRIEPEPEAHPNLWKSVPAAPVPEPVRPRLPPIAITAAAAALADESDDVPVRGWPAAEPRAEVALPEPSVSRQEEPELKPRRLLFPPSDRPETPDVGRRSSTLSRDWMSRPLLRTRPLQPPTEPPPLFAGPSSDLEDDRAPPILSPGPDRDTDAHGADASHGFEPSLEPEQAHEPEVSVVGRYQAGSSTYTMFSNGAIDVDTEGGDTHHFTSMDELKSFIARQENAVS